MNPGVKFFLRIDDGLIVFGVVSRRVRQKIGPDRLQSTRERQGIRALPCFTTGEQTEFIDDRPCPFLRIIAAQAIDQSDIVHWLVAGHFVPVISRLNRKAIEHGSTGHGRPSPIRRGPPHQGTNQMSQG